jgi:PAS domain S-box-containing protein
MAAVTDRGFFATAGLLADALPDGMVTVDSAGTIVSVNSPLLAMTGYLEQDLLGTSVDRLVPAARRDTHAGRRLSFISDPVVRPMGSALDTACQRADGSVFPVDIALAPLSVDGESYVVATIRDATERRALEEARRASDESFRLLIESAAGLAIFTLDAQGNVTSWNAGAERLKGYAAEEILGQPFTVFYTSSDVAAGVPKQLLAEAATKGRAEAFGRRVRKDGSQFQASVLVTALHDANGSVQGFTKITRDISTALQARDVGERLHLLEQREQLGRDLHDGAIQAMFAVGMGLQALAREVDNPAVAGRLDESIRALDDTITELRAFIFGLSADLTPDQVRHELERLAAQVAARSGIEVTGTTDSQGLETLGSKGRGLLLVAREALSNVERHSHASRCTMTFHLGEDDVPELIIADNGRGFDVTKATGGLGLNNARIRADEMDAEYAVHSSTTGTTVVLRFPSSR